MKNFTKQLAILASLLCWSALAVCQTTIAQWTFTGDVTTPETGTGTASIVGGATATFATGFLGGADRAWNTTTYAAQSTGSKTRGVQFASGTTGYENIQLTFNLRHSNTAANTVVVQYSTDGGLNFIDGPTITFTPAASGTGDTWFERSADLSAITALDNNPNAVFRIVSAFDPVAGQYLAARSTSSYATTGTMRYDDVTILGNALPALPAMRITEYLYDGTNGEFVEFTNVGNSSVDMTGWSFDDDSNTPGVLDLSAFGTVQAGESVIISELSASAFRTAWNLCANVKVIGGYTNNLGRNDQINLYDGDDNLVDRLTYGDQNFAGSIRTTGRSGWVSAAGLGANDPYAWTLSTAGDSEGSYAATGGSIGSPGKSTRATVAYNPCTVVAAAPTITISGTTTKRLLGTASNPPSPYAVSGVIGDPTDPAANSGLNFILNDTDTPLNDLIVTVSSSNMAVVTNANLTLSGSGADRNLRIVPSGVGFSLITLMVSDGTNTTNYIINYGASAGSTTPATTRWYTGASDASTAVPFDGNYIYVADDENQVLRMYPRAESGLPEYGFDATPFLALTDISGGAPREVDIEGSFSIGNRIFWIGSHGNGSEGQNRPNRRRLFATDVNPATGALTYVGKYENLRDNLVAWGDANGYNFSNGIITGTLPTVAEGFNIEGFTLAPNGTTAFIGFRAPRVPINMRNNALIAPILNFQTWFNNGAPAGAPTFGAPIELNLGGRAIRSIECNGNGCIIVAGNTDESGNFKLYTWSGNPADAPQPRTADLTGMSPEGLLDIPGTPFLGAAGNNLTVQLISDNGTRDFYNNGTEAKDLPEGNHKKFRSDLVSLGEVDLPAPMIVIAPSPLTVECDGSGNTAALSAWLANNAGATAQVACGQGTWMKEQLSNVAGCGNTRCLTYLFTITDECGRSDMATATFCIEDTNGPNLIALNNTATLQADGTYTLQLADVLNIAASADVCGSFNINSISPQTLTCDQLGQTVSVTITAMDACGNEGTATANITVAEGTALPENWSAANIGATANGASNYASCNNDGSFTLQSSGFPTSTTDVAHVVYQNLCGDGMITARLTDISGTGWAGLIMRETNTAGAKKFSIKSRLATAVRRDARLLTNGSTQTQQIPVSAQHTWLRVVRSGNVFYAYISVDGEVWAPAGTAAAINMSSCISVGLFVENTNNATETVATFDQVSLSGNGSNNLAIAAPSMVAADSEDVNLSAYPNPTSGSVRLKLPESYMGKDLEIVLMNASGTELARLFTNDDQPVVDLSEHAAGFYFLRIVGEGLPVQTLRIVRSGTRP